MAVHARSSVRQEPACHSGRESSHSPQSPADEGLTQSDASLYVSLVRIEVAKTFVHLQFLFGRFRS